MRWHVAASSPCMSEAVAHGGGAGSQLFLSGSLLLRRRDGQDAAVGAVPCGAEGGIF